MGNIIESILDKGLYDEIDISEDDTGQIDRVLNLHLSEPVTIKHYCSFCNEDSVFSVLREQTKTRESFIRKTGMPFLSRGDIRRIQSETFQSYVNKFYCISFMCNLSTNHFILVDVFVTNTSIIKIGQYPSIADISVNQISKYKSLLKDNFAELSKAIGLFSHGVGIGSFVYLRRIIENLIQEKIELYLDDTETKREDLPDKFVDKIKVLDNYLPEILVKNRNLYGIISKGLHELSEKECLEMFPVIRMGVELILDDIIEEQRKKDKTKEFDTFVASKTGELKQR